MMKQQVVTCNEKNGFDEAEKFLGLEYRDVDAICRHFDMMCAVIAQKRSSENRNDA